MAHASWRVAFVAALVIALAAAAPVSTISDGGFLQPDASFTAGSGAVARTEGAVEVMRQWFSDRFASINVYFVGRDAATEQQEEKDKYDSLAAMDPKRRAMYFRPVSTTLWCVMALTIQGLIVYTALALSRNVDELSGKNEPSSLTASLTVASRCAVCPSMMCMLFVGCRMYVLATTGGLGEPPVWVKACMIISTAAMTLQFLVVILLPLALEGPPTDPDADDWDKENLDNMDVLVGGPRDSFPAPDFEKFSDASVGKSFWGFECLILLMLYGGIIGVFVGIATYPAQQTKISPAVICVCLLSGLYFFIQGALWVVHTISGLQELEEPPAAEHALICASNTVKKAPMIAVFFLCARMRALQLDPPLGMPPFWAQCCFFALTAAVYLEALTAAIIGATGDEVDQEHYTHEDKLCLKMLKDIYGVRTFKASHAVHMMHHLCSFVVLLTIFPVIASCFLMKDAHGNTQPLSHMLKAVLWYQLLYFGISAIQSFAFFMRDVCEQHWDLTESTVLAAGVSVSFVPLLCILFVACRMRALQITNQEGSPPGWAQDCFFLSVIATYTQVLCCIMMPIFTNAAVEVDGDGNATYDLRPMVGAYAVAIMKYICLFALHTGVVVVCIAVFIMTPETAKREPDPFSMRKVYETIAFALLAIIISMLLSSAKVIGLAVKLGVESVPEWLLGAKIKCKSAAMSICRGYVSISGFKVENPVTRLNHEDYQCHWKSIALFKIDELTVKVNVWRLISTFGKEFELTYIALRGINVIAEKPSMKEYSNVAIVKEYLDANIPHEEEETKEQKAQRLVKEKEEAVKDKEKAAEEKQKAKEAAKKKAEEKARLKKEGKEVPEEDDGTPMVVVGRVEIEDVCARLVSPWVKVKIGIPEVHCEFTEKEGGGMKPMEVVAKIVKSIIVSSAKHTSEHFRDFGKNIARAAGNCATGCGTGVQKICGAEPAKTLPKQLDNKGAKSQHRRPIKTEVPEEPAKVVR